MVDAGEFTTDFGVVHLLADRQVPTSSNADIHHALTLLQAALFDAGVSRWTASTETRTDQSREQWPMPVVLDEDLPEGTFELHTEHQIVRCDTTTGEWEVLWDDRDVDDVD